MADGEQSLSDLERKLGPWNPEIQEDDAGLFSVMVTEGDLDQACELLPDTDCLAELAICGDSFTDRGLQALLSHRRERLQFLTVRSSRLSGEGLQHLHAAPRLKRLLVEFRGYPNLAFQGLGKCKQLELLDITCRDDDLATSLNHLDELSNLSELGICSRDLGIGLTTVLSLPELRSLSLESHSLNNSLFPPSGHPSCLQYLDLSLVEMSDETISTLTPLRGLESLSLEGGKLTRVGLRELQSFKELEELKLRNVNVDGDAIRELMHTNVQTLHFTSEKDVDDHIVSALCQCTFLSRLCIYNPLSKQQQTRLSKSLGAAYA